MNKRNLLPVIGGSILALFILIGAIAAVYVALKTNTTAPVAPTVPQIRPLAADINQCTLTFIVAVPTTTLKCDSVTLDPNDTNIATGGQTRALTVNASGGASPLTYSWVTTGGTLSATSGKSVTWTGPAALSGAQSWTITATVADAASQTATSDKCKVTLNFGGPICKGSCQTNNDCPANLTCFNNQCRNNACPTDDDCVCPPAPKVCNSTCTVASECQAGLTCAGGNCRNATCINDQDCVCNPAAPVCNSTCTTSADCPSGMACSNGSCRNPACTTATNCVCPSGRSPTGGAGAPPPPVPQPAPKTHLVCRNNACVTVSGAGLDTCTSDVSCQPKAAPPPIPKSGVELPTIMTIVGGVALLVIGILAL